MKKNSITVEKKIQLELWLYSHYEFYETFQKNNIILSSLFTEEERQYLFKAYRMPFQIIKERLEIYNKEGKLKRDESELLYDLQRQLGIEDTILMLERIRTVKKMNQYYSQHPNTQEIPQIRICDHLVRDHIECLEGMPIYSFAQSNESYWNYLLGLEQKLSKNLASSSQEESLEYLIDKLELIRAMAEAKGYSLSEIFNKTDEKKAEQGGYGKQHVLQKIIINPQK